MLVGRRLKPLEDCQSESVFIVDPNVFCVSFRRGKTKVKQRHSDFEQPSFAAGTAIAGSLKTALRISRTCCVATFSLGLPEATTLSL